MAHASTDTDESRRERAVSDSSELGSTRPNPFDDSDVLSRKRQRTSLNGTSRSLSVDTVQSPSLHTSPTAPVVGPEPPSDSAMRIDTDPTTPTTPEPQQCPDARPPYGNPSGGVTMVMRTPSRPDKIVTSPTSPGDLPSAADPAEAVHTSVEEPEIDMSCQEDSVVETPESLRPDSHSPPVEVIPVDSDDSDDGYDIVIDEAPQPPYLRTFGRSQPPDPSSGFPFHDPTETHSETITRLSTYIPEHDAVSRSLADWIAKYLDFAQAAEYGEVMESWRAHRNVWRHLPELVLTLVNHKRQPTSQRMSSDVRQEAFGFFKQFARLTAFFIALDSRTLRDAVSTDPSWSPDLASVFYTNVLGVITRREELFPRSESLLGNVVDEWGDMDVADILDTFQTFHKNQGGTLAYIKQLANSETALLARFPRLNEHLAQLSAPVCNIMFLSCRRAQIDPLQDATPIKGNLIRGYAFFKTVSAALANIIDKHVNHLSLDTAQSLIPALSDIYQYCLNLNGLVELLELKAAHRLSYPLIQQLHRSEVMALHWKFVLLRKLIVSSQMQLRVMAVTAMCSDLVSIWRRFGDGTNFNRPVIDYFSNFLLETGLVTYILGPNCHPEITLESSNIVGFLGISGTYTKAHTDAVWQTITSSQNPRVQDALIRMMNKVSNLLNYDAVLYLSEKVLSLPVESFGPTMREFWDTINKHMHSRGVGPQLVGSNMASYELCARLLRHASVPGNQCPVAHPELQKIAMLRLDELVGPGTPDECRQHIYLDCLDDIARKTPYTAGSLWILSLLLRYTMNRDLRPLTVKHDLPRLLVEELEATIPAMRAAGCTAVLSGAPNAPRLELLSAIIHREPASISKALGQRLWNLMVGAGAASREDRDVAWQVLNMASRPDKDGIMNPFLGLCFSDCFPALSKQYFCPGALDFVHAQLKPLLHKGSLILDQEVAPNYTGLEQLWRMILTAPVGTIEGDAIAILVRDVYLDSDCILAFSHDRALKVHLSLLDRCFEWMSLAATRLKALRDAGTNGNSHPTEGVLEQELMFIRSLSVLREFHQLHRNKPHFSEAFDMRQLTCELPIEVLGDLAELKYQGFDGEAQTESLTLRIGRRNTLGDLLATLREATGFRDYRIYYRGCPFVPQQDDIGKSLEDCRMHDGNLLIKRVVDSPETPHAETPSVEGKILAHFKDLWDYLSLEGTLDPAQGVYRFLVDLPVDPSILGAIEDPSTPYLELFPPSEPLKTLYALRGMRQYLATQRQQATSSQLQQYLDDPETNNCPLATSLGRAMALVVSVLSDQAVAGEASQECRMELSSSLLESFVDLLNEPLLPVSAAQLLDASLLDTLVGVASTLPKESAPSEVSKIAGLCLRGIFTACSMSPEFMAAFRTHDNFRTLLGQLLVFDERTVVRQTAVHIIKERVLEKMEKQPSSLTRSWQQYFWPVVSDLVGSALATPSRSNEVMGLCVMMFMNLMKNQPEILKLQSHLDDWLTYLLHYTTIEDATKPGIVDLAVSNLVKLLQLLLCNDVTRQKVNVPSGVSRKIFWTHLFPPPESHKKFSVIAHNKQVHCSETRAMIVDILFVLIRDEAELAALLSDLNLLVPVYGESEEYPYAYDLAPAGFERSKAIRAPCGYAGIKNLSNTCYFNSLLAQLYMNIDFRRFVLNTQGFGPDRALLFETRKLFGHMQNTLGRYVVPDDLVKTIRTYDEAELDVHNQMDVDEFYNLWNDRLEGQFLNSAERNQFRSFYGGQLVQQVASKECSHISERLEPFSAIQCDIKGKSSLQESLETYVDGEIMEGENKYNCSQCDRHVDAVKRTCLKVIPDNLIFHLKRFDFNLRQMQRNKINDRFAFPDKIDMRPYTIEHLSNSPDGKDEDVFELVGVLVHSGTAESGHYYSYARERPSSSDSPAWMEFNDDVVTTWDPALMESACFGGSEHRDQFDGSAGMVEKTYSAYMLFYQRSSSLAKGQALLEQTRRPSPMAITVPREMSRHIDEENVQLLRRHCISDTFQIRFVNMALNRLREHYGGCSDDHGMEATAITMALSFLDQVAARAKDLTDFFKLLNHIGGLCRSCGFCSLIAYQYFVTHSDVLRFLVQKSPDAEVRRGTGRLVLQILDALKTNLPLEYGVPDEDLPQQDLPGPSDVDGDGDGERRRGPRRRWSPPPRTALLGVMKMFHVLWESFHASLRSWPEVFGLMLAFVQMGPHEMYVFLQQPFLQWLLSIIWADPNLDMPVQFLKMINNVQRRIPTRQPSYEAIIGLVDVLTKKAKLLHGGGGLFAPATPAARFRGQDDLDGPYPYTAEETRILEFEWTHGAGNFFVDRLLAINQNQAATHSIIASLIKQSKIMEHHIYRTLLHNITGLATPQPVGPYLVVAGHVFCRHASQPELVGNLIQHVSQQCMNLRNLEGRAFVAFQNWVFDGEQENTGRSLQQIVSAGYDNIPEWAPGLLGCADADVVKDTELFLQDKLFQPAAASTAADGVEGGWTTDEVVRTARQLGGKCLEYLRVNYINRQEEVSVRLVAGLERTVHECSKFFDATALEDGEFIQIRDSTLDSLRRLTVEDIEEDGVGMFYSDSSSVASSNTAG